MLARIELQSIVAVRRTAPSAGHSKCTHSVQKVKDGKLSRMTKKVMLYDTGRSD